MSTQPSANLADMVRERANSRGNATAYEFEGRATSRVGKGALFARRAHHLATITKGVVGTLRFAHPTIQCYSA